MTFLISAAKLGLVGMNNTLAVEGKKNNIHCNVILPMAKSRLTEDVMPPEMLEMLKPELVAPIVAWLVHEDCEDSGSVIEAAGGWSSKYRWQRSNGSLLLDSADGAFDVEKVRSKWTEITDMEADGFEFPASNQEATVGVVGKLGELSKAKKDKVAHSNNKMDAVGFESEPFDYIFSHREVILYALAVGASTRDRDGGLRLIYEGDENFAPLPTFAVVPSFGGLAGVLSGKVPGLNIDLAKILHGEQYTEMLADVIPTSGRMTSTFVVRDVLDKGSGCVVIVDMLTRDEYGNDLFKTQWSIFGVGEGNFGGPRSSNHAVETKKSPVRQPDASREYKTSVDQVII